MVGVPLTLKRQTLSMKIPTAYGGAKHFVQLSYKRQFDDAIEYILQLLSSNCVYTP